jgi:hypothetical protein
MDRTYLPPFLSSFVLSNLSHITLVIVPDIPHVGDQEMLLLEEMDRVVYHQPMLSVHSLSFFCCLSAPLCSSCSLLSASLSRGFTSCSSRHILDDLPTTCALRSASKTSGQTAAWHYPSAQSSTRNVKWIYLFVFL